VTDEIEKVFRPEFINRVNDIIVFRHLTDNDMKQVIDLELGKVRDRLKEKGIALELTDEAKEFLVKKGTNLDFGARPLRRAIESFIEDPLAEELLKGEFAGKNTVKVEVKKVGDKKQLVFNGHAAGQPVDMTPPPSGEPVGAGAGTSTSGGDSLPPAGQTS
jgi:ATP-dependent Clp protease ATP-binding subunit ClpC